MILYNRGTRDARKWVAQTHALRIRNHKPFSIAVFSCIVKWHLAEPVCDLYRIAVGILQLYFLREPFVGLGFTPINYIFLQVSYSNIGQTVTFLCDSLLQNTFVLSNPSDVSSFPLRAVSPTLSARAPQFCLSSPVIIANKDSLHGSWCRGFRALKVLENQQINWDWDQQLSEWTSQTSVVLICLF